MIATGLLILAVFGFIALAVRGQRKKESDAEQNFRMTMLTLEEKAKREGTFKVSYFDKEQK